MSDASSQVPCLTEEQLEAVARDEHLPQEVSGHVEGCRDCQAAVGEIRANNEFLLEVATTLGRRPGPADLAPPDTEAIPGYLIESEISRGGQGVVYKAVQISTRRHVAVKVLGSGILATSQQRMRFEREIELAASLRHPNIVTVHESGVTGEGLRYIVMEYVDGQCLDQFAAASQEPAGRGRAATRSRTRGLLHLFSKVCEAVWHAHQRGVIHRDLKPSNILVTQEGNLDPANSRIERAEPKVLDFGLAKPVVASAKPEATMDGEFVGSLAYASPEQVRGDVSEIDIRTDVYSLGVILYELLAGRHPYPATDSMPEMIRHITEAQTVKPSAVRPWLDDEIDTIVLKAMAKDKARRYQSAADLARDIAHYLKDEPIEARRDRSWYVIRKMVRRKRWHLLLAVSCAALAVSLLALRWRSLEFAESRDMAIIQGEWAEPGGDDPAGPIYEAFFARLADGRTTEEERNTMFSHALEATLHTRRSYSMDRRIAAIVDLRRRVDFVQYGLTPLVTVSLSINDQVFARKLRFPLSGPELRLTRQTDRDATPLSIKPPTAAELVAEFEFEVHWTRDVPAVIQQLPRPPELNVLEHTVWRQVRTVHHDVQLFHKLSPDYPTAIVDEKTAVQVEQGFHAVRVRVNESALFFECDYNGKVPIAADLQILALSGEELLQPSKFTLPAKPGAKIIDRKVTLPAEFLEAVRDGSIGTVRVLITPKRGVALLVHDLDFYYGLPIEREVPVVLIPADDSRRSSVRKEQEEG